MSFQDVVAVLTRLQPVVDAVAALGARAAVGDDMAPEIAAAVDDVLAAAGVPDLASLAPPQRNAIAVTIRSLFAQAADLLADPTRPPGWRYTDPIVLEGTGRGSTMVVALLSERDELKPVSAFLDVGVGVGWLAVAAARAWPDSTVVGIDVWEPALERARRNVADAGLADRVEVRHQDVVDLHDVDRFDLAWVPSTFLGRDMVEVALERIVAATRPGGHVVVGHYRQPDDPLARATWRLRTVRDGGTELDNDTIADLLVAAGCTDVRPLPPTPRVPLAFVAGRKP